jgi:type IV secretory pathway protease TraF
VEPLGKRVVAVEGDRVEIDEAGKVSVEGKEVPGSGAWNRRALGWEFRTWVGQQVRLAKGEVWLFAPHPRSFDSRVFGPVGVDALRGSIEPVWVGSQVGSAQKASG